MSRKGMWLINHDIEAKNEELATGFLCPTCLTNDSYLNFAANGQQLHNKQNCAGCGCEIDKGLRFEFIAEKINTHLNKHYKIIKEKDFSVDLVSLRDILRRFIIDNENVIKSISGLLYDLNNHRFEDGAMYKDLYDQNAIMEQTSAIVEEWNQYEFELKHLKRFTNKKAIDFYKTVISFGVHASDNNSPMLKVIATGTEFFRGRRVLDDNHKNQLKLDHKEFYPPPPEKTANSRMSPPGMPFLYTATDQKTCIAELHPFAGDEIAVIKLETERSLYFFDLTRAADVKHKLPGLIYDPAAKLYACRHLLSRLHDLIAQPFRATDITYTAIQAFAETVRHYEFSHGKEKRNFDGIIFNSTQMNGGVNYVFFGDIVTELRTESPLRDYGVKPSVNDSVKFFKIENIQVTTSSSILD